MTGFFAALRAFAKRQNETIDTQTIPIPLPGLPPALDGYRIVVIADLHIAQPGPYHTRILRAVSEARPECILVAGDTIDAKTGATNALGPFFAALSGMAPTVAVLGNNDCLRGRIYNLREMYREAGVTLLENETRLLCARGLPVRITGLSDPEAERRGVMPERDAPRQRYVPLSDALPPAPETPAAIGSPPEGDARLPSLLLLHRPNLARQYVPMHPSLIVAGHAHGGQFRLPGGHGLIAPDQGLWPRLTGGLYDLEGVPLVVSRGLGNHHIRLRLNNPPHLPLIVLKKEETR